MPYPGSTVSTRRERQHENPNRDLARHRPGPDPGSAGDPAMTPLERWLGILGELSPRQIYRLLLASGIRGVPGDACRCPVAQVLADESIYKGRPIVSGFSCWVDGPWGHERVELPPSVATFIERFDTGRYRKLRANTITPTPRDA